MPSAGAATSFHCSQPIRPSVIQVTSPPPAWHMVPGSGGMVLQAVAGFTCTSDFGALVLGGMASASYQPITPPLPPMAPPLPPMAPPLPPMAPPLPPVALPPEPPSPLAPPVLPPLPPVVPTLPPVVPTLPPVAILPPVGVLEGPVPPVSVSSPPAPPVPAPDPFGPPELQAARRSTKTPRSTVFIEAPRDQDGPLRQLERTRK